MSLEEFIRLLEESLDGTPQGYQFPERRKFLEQLFRSGMVIDARLVIPNQMRSKIEKTTLQAIQPSWIVENQNTSFVCLRCIDDVFIIEGTHNFALRGFVGAHSFPIRGYWDAGPRAYRGVDFRVARISCPIWEPHQGAWVEKFLNKLRYRHIEWDIDP
jgi:type 1 glutamine amidotransferase